MRRSTTVLPVSGSSPRMRGTQQPAGKGVVGRRFIPAYAGNAPATPWSLWTTPVHPRVCGERASGALLTWGDTGSSPRMRGTQLALPRQDLDGRFIPAYAGNAQPVSRPCRSDPVHPRVCGERATSTSWNCVWTGSSPRMRGTPAFRCAGRGVRRFIPAYAGNAARRHHREQRAPVHPRVCGERTPHSLCCLTSCGSSPRMRGTHRVKWQDRQLRRFIPAYAGNAPQ